MMARKKQNEKANSEIITMLEIVRQRIKKAIENGETNNAKTEIEIFERLVKIQKLESEQRKDIKPHALTCDRAKLLKAIEDKFNRLEKSAQENQL